MPRPKGPAKLSATEWNAGDTAILRGETVKVAKVETVTAGGMTFQVCTVEFPPKSESIVGTDLRPVPAPAAETPAPAAETVKGK